MDVQIRDKAAVKIVHSVGRCYDDARGEVALAEEDVSDEPRFPGIALRDHADRRMILDAVYVEFCKFYTSH